MASLPFLEPPSISMASSSSSLLRVLPFLSLRLQLYRHGLNAASRLTQPRWPFCTTAGESTAADAGAASSSEEISSVREATKYSRWNDPDYRQWRDKEDEIFKDIEPIFLLAKDILHSSRYLDGEHLKPEDMKAVVEMLLVYHPHADDKVGCGLDSIMVDRHPEFKQSRCLFLIRTDGAWIDFSYQKCLRQYIREKYPSHAERFIREHFKRGS